MDQKAKAYFEKSAIKYSKGDVIALLDSRLPCAGPLLTTTLNGIDNLGGMCYGFDQKVGDRSVKTMIKKMEIPQALAEFLYEAVRCGIVHQGMPKMGVKYFVGYDRLEEHEIFYNGPDGYITMIVTEFAYRYLDTIEKIASEPEKHINFYPAYNEERGETLKNMLDEARVHINRDIESYFLVLYNAEGKERLENGESSAAYTEDMQFSMDLPPEE
ncbi:hypothetical protein KA005_48560 [bacterium]|nr:hypothetical protein [bacterium]